jgi:hypothetical protein
MSKFNSAAATGLPVSTRRSLLAGLAATPLAVVPLIARARCAEHDPVIALIAQYGATKEAANAAGNVVSRIEDEHRELGRGLHAKVLIDGTVCDVGSEEILEHLLKSVDPVTRDQVWRDLEASYRRMLGGCGAPHEFSTAEDQARWQEQAVAARAAFRKAEEDLALLEAATGYDVAEARADALCGALWKLEDAILEAVPTTRADALALIRFVIDLLELEDGDDRHRAALARAHALLVREEA